MKIHLEDVAVTRSHVSDRLQLVLDLLSKIVLLEDIDEAEEVDSSE